MILYFMSDIFVLKPDFSRDVHRLYKSVVAENENDANAIIAKINKDNEDAFSDDCAYIVKATTTTITYGSSSVKRHTSRICICA